MRPSGPGWLPPTLSPSSLPSPDPGPDHCFLGELEGFLGSLPSFITFGNRQGEVLQKPLVQIQCGLFESSTVTGLLQIVQSRYPMIVSSLTKEIDTYALFSTCVTTF